VYWTISEKRNDIADAETSAIRVLLRFLSYMFGRGPAGLEEPRVVCIEGALGRENRVEVGENWSTEDWEELERTERRGCG
jgi:hypothetical protein